MHHALRVGVADGVEQGAEEAEDLVHGHALAAPEEIVEIVFQRDARDVLHDHVVLLAFDVEVEDLHDVGVMELGDGLRLALEAPQEVGRLGEVRVHDLDRDKAIQVGVESFVDLGHAAAPETFLELIFAEGMPGEIGHKRDYR